MLRESIHNPIFMVSVHHRPLDPIKAGRRGLASARPPASQAKNYAVFAILTATGLPSSSLPFAL